MYRKVQCAVFTVVGATVMGLSLNLFLIPLQIAAGGVGGAATVIHYVSGLSVGVLILLLNIPIFWLGAMHFSKRFLYYSLLGTVALSISTQVFSVLPALTDDPLLAAVFGGAGTGVGLSMVLKVNGSTGGTDILALILKKRFPTFSVGQFFILIDGCVIAAAGLVFGRWEVILYSVLTLFVSSKVVDAFLSGLDYADMVYIMSDRAEEIAAEIDRQMRRGVTGLEAVSFYTQRRKRVLLCVIRKPEVVRLRHIVHEIDPAAFMILSEAKEVLGNGFKTPML